MDPFDDDIASVSSIGGDSLDSNHDNDIGTGLNKDTNTNGDNKKNEVGSVSAGDVDEEERKAYFESHALIVDGFRCPDHLLNRITPLEFEELVSLFKSYDNNGNGLIDAYEARKILQSLGLDYSMEKAEDLIKLIDEDGSGEIDFDEYCEFIVLLKDGDDRFAQFSGFLDKMKDTPLGILDHQCGLRGLRSNFHTVETREATAFSPMVLVVELQLSGTWYGRNAETGQTTMTVETKKFQGMAGNARDAKYAAANLAISRLGDLMPGVFFTEGDVPDDWMTWIDDNLRRGVDANKIVHILKIKGFHPHKNLKLMQRISLWYLFTDFLIKHPDFDLTGTLVINPYFQQWVKDMAMKGYDGDIILQVVKDQSHMLEDEHLLFAQKLRKNELGQLFEIDGKTPIFLDFWQACSDGSYDVVLLYLNAGQLPNEERIGRGDSHYLSPLSLAAKNGHNDIVLELIKFDADVKAIDTTGKSALHYAALHGHIAAARVLLDNGALIYEGDFVGNCALHMAAGNNAYAMVDFLASTGQSLTRDILSDKIRVCEKSRPHIIFDTLAAEIFESLQDQKLKETDLRRFEKTWCSEAAEVFIKSMDPHIRFRIAKCGNEIAQDVLNRFDPRPETGVSVKIPITGKTMMIPTVPSGKELAIILRYMFRQSSLDCVNSWNRTPLHSACDLNKIDSHHAVITLLIETYGANVLIRDIHNRRPIDLLFKHKVSLTQPSSSQEKEELIMIEREKQLEKFSEAFKREEDAYSLNRRMSVLHDCINRANNLYENSWEATREACVLKDVYKKWEMYEDPDTLNFMYAKVPHDKLNGDKYSCHTWSVPTEIKAIRDYRIALNYQVEVRSVKLRVFGRWSMYRCKIQKLDFLFDNKTYEVRYTIPPEYSFKRLTKRAKVIDKLGFGYQWEVLVDVYGNTFYRNYYSRDCFWDRPIDAIKVESKDRFCTCHQYGHAARKQKWYSCEQCNRAWTTSGDTTKLIIRICEPCIFRCHSGHKGIRFAMESDVTCCCSTVCKVIGTACNGLQFSQLQVATQAIAYDNRTEVIRRREEVVLMPLVFAMVPRVWPDGSSKIQSGWMLCRRPPPAGLAKFGKLIISDNGSTSSDDDSDGGDDANVPDNESKTIASNSSKTATSKDLSLAASTNDEDVISDAASKAGSVVRRRPLTGREVDSLSKDGFHYSPPPGLPDGWIEVLDVEDPEVIPIDARVLVVCYNGPPKCYGNIVASTDTKGFYRINYDHTDEDEVVARERIEVISKVTFFCNILTGQSAWTIDQACSNPYTSSSLHLPGYEWLDLMKVSDTRRTFSSDVQYEEQVYKYQHQPGYAKKFEFIYYASIDTYKREKSVLVIQKFMRQKFQFPVLKSVYVSNAFTFDATADIEACCREKAGWAYLRRRSLNIGDFLDRSGVSWEEYMDQVSCEYFYYQENENEYLWLKPPLPDFKRADAEVKSYYSVGDVFMYTFPGRRTEESVVITKLRFDDETGEDMYDIAHKYKPDQTRIWVNRALLKPISKSGDVLMLMLLEAKWRDIIKRQKDKEERNRRRKKDMRLQAEAYQLQLIKAGKASVASSNASIASGDNDTLNRIRARVNRVAAEEADYNTELDRGEGLQRRDKVREMIEAVKASNSKKRYTRAEVLSMTRAFDLKLRMEEKVQKRDIVQNELTLRKEATIKRNADAEEMLRLMEQVNETPRSLARRKVIRKVNMSMRRQQDMYMICEWGCGEWIKVGFEQLDHQLKRCPKRVLGCTLGCPLKMSEEEWLRPAVTKSQAQIEEEALSKTMHAMAEKVDGITVQQYHETEECIKRVVACPLICLEYIMFDQLEVHMAEMCVKRPAKPIFCRLGCGCQWGGMVEKLIEAENDRLQHETEECDYRIVRCDWEFDDGRRCAAQMPANNRDEHRNYHLLLLGINTYKVPGTYLFTVPKKITKLKVQLWGAGGGSGYFQGRQSGSGGGGAFVEAIITVEPFDVLEIVVGSGGGAGNSGTEIESIKVEEMRKSMKDVVVGGVYETKRLQFDVLDASCGQSVGGVPGGGVGYGGGKFWACGGGGGYSIVSKRTANEIQALLVAGGGGGGGSIDGLPGGAMTGSLPGTRLDIRNGKTATVDGPGAGGDSGSIFNSAWIATDGSQWLGGNGCEFGGGGGGGYFGGGGGGNSPGVGGSGGGGSSYVYTPVSSDYVVISGNGYQPGGLNHHPFDACGLGEWDVVGGYVGQGAIGSTTKCFSGNNGGVKIVQAGHF